MFKLKHTNTVSLFLVIVAVAAQFMVGSAAALPPAGCPGGPAGPPSAGTVCPDGSTPVRDGTLPIGCPGSSQQGPVGGNYTAQCPARPGREACTYSQATQQCLTASGQNAMPGATPTATPSAPAGGATPTSAPATAGGGRDCKAASLTPQNCWIVSYVVDAINILSGLAGVVIVIMIAVGGLQYSASRDNPQATAAAKQKIINALLALLFFIFGFALLQYLVPGGILN